MKTLTTSFFQKLEPADVIALTVVVGALILNWKGIPTMLSAAVSLIVGYYFGRSLTKKRN